MCDTYELAQNLMVALNTPRALSVYLLIKYKEYEQVARLKIDPRDYADADLFKVDAQAVNFLRKANLDIGVDTEQAAIDSWFKAEAQCFKTNRRITSWLNISQKGSALDVIRANPDLALTTVVSKIQRHIASILGKAPSIGGFTALTAASLIGVAPVYIEGAFGNGSTQSDAGIFTTVPDKIASRPTITPQLSRSREFGDDWFSTLWGRLHFSYNTELEISRYNSFFTVPKTALTKRGCGLGPSINAHYQLGLGRLLRSRLRTYGLDLAVTQENHKLMAWRSSKDDSLATIDLEMASDTLAYETVKLLLPPDWFFLFDTLRESFTSVRVDGQTKVVKIEKFSAMGNGFTFELETLIFHAIAYVMCNYKVGGTLHDLLQCISQYGDDCIVEVQHASKVMAAFRWFGFLINEGKTFTAGPFRESCGGDYFNGVDVRSFNLKEELHGPKEIISVYNGIHRRFAVPLFTSNSSHYGAGAGEIWYSDSIKHFCLALRKQVPSDIRKCVGPPILGDTCFNTYDDRHWCKKRKGSFLYVKTFNPVAVYRELGKYDEGSNFVASVFGMRAVLRYDLKKHIDPNKHAVYPYNIWEEQRVVAHRVINSRDVSYISSWTQLPG